MRDYTYNGTPVAQMRTRDIETCLRKGIEINDSDGLASGEAVACVMERLRLELFIRERNLRG